MGTFTAVEPKQLTEFLGRYGVEKYESFRGVDRGSVNSNFALEIGGQRTFLRVYEEQDEAGASREVDLLRWLAERGVPTPAPIAMKNGAYLGTLAGKPAALFPFVDGDMSCQRGLTAARMTLVGATLARLHALRPPTLWPTRFGAPQLHARLERIARDVTYGALAAPLAAALDRAWAARDDAAPRGLIHGDVFRDNVLWDGDRMTALLDFESASEGPFAYDLAVTTLAFGFDARFVPELVRPLFAGYVAARPLAPRERSAIFDEARVAALRFTITRLTDYAMRAGAAMAQKDYRRFEARLAELDAMGPSGFAALTGL